MQQRIITKFIFFIPVFGDVDVVALDVPLRLIALGSLGPTFLSPSVIASTAMMPARSSSFSCPATNCINLDQWEGGTAQVHSGISTNERARSGIES